MVRSDCAIDMVAGGAALVADTAKSQATPFRAFEELPQRLDFEGWPSS